MAEYYMSYTGSELDDAINKVKNGYVDGSKVSQYYESSLDLRNKSHTLSCEFNVGFKPRLFLIVTVNSLTVTNSAYYVGAFWHAEYITGVGEYSAGFATNNTTANPAYNGATHYSYSNGIVRISDPTTEDKDKHWFMGGKLYRVFAMA